MQYKLTLKCLDLLLYVSLVANEELLNTNKRAQHELPKNLP
jgi:hypothetical protein